ELAADRRVAEVPHAVLLRLLGRGERPPRDRPALLQGVLQLPLLVQSVARRAGDPLVGVEPGLDGLVVGRDRRERGAGALVDGVPPRYRAAIPAATAASPAHRASPLVIGRSSMS